MKLLFTPMRSRGRSRSRLLSARVASLIQDTDNQVLVSAVSADEIEFKRVCDPVLAALPADLDEAVRLQGVD